MLPHHLSWFFATVAFILVSDIPLNMCSPMQDFPKLKNLSKSHDIQWHKRTGSHHFWVCWFVVRTSSSAVHTSRLCPHVPGKSCYLLPHHPFSGNYVAHCHRHHHQHHRQAPSEHQLLSSSALVSPAADWLTRSVSLFTLAWFWSPLLGASAVKSREETFFHDDDGFITTHCSGKMSVLFEWSSRGGGSMSHYSLFPLVAGENVGLGCVTNSRMAGWLEKNSRGVTAARVQDCF